MNDNQRIQVITPQPELAEELRTLTPQERLQWLQRRLDLCIQLTPTSIERAAMTEANIMILSGLESISV